MKFHQRNLVRGRLEEWLHAADLSGKVLDVGCGNSRYSQLAAERVGVDHVFGRGVDVVADIHLKRDDGKAYTSVFTTAYLREEVERG